ncbi:MAG: gamma-glutamyltransferase [Lysobacterales bacterium]
MNFKHQTISRWPRIALWLVLLLLPTLALALAEVKPHAAGIASANKQATEAGFEILAQGGNAFDAAVAVSAALAVVEPESSGLGGGGFFLLHRASDGKAVFVDAREKAPLAASRDMYLDAEGNAQRALSVNGALAAGIPGLPAGLVLVAERYGKLPLKQSLAPAIRLARKGYIWSAKNSAMIGFRTEQLAKSEGAAALFLRKGKPPAKGDRVFNQDIARVLERIASEGHRGFYDGKTARTLVEGVKAAGGIWSLDDLAQYQAVEREPLRFQFQGEEILTSPPPSSGGVALVGLFQILSGYPLAEFDRVQRLHVEIEAMRRVYRDRAIYLGDPDFVQVPMQMLLSPYYAAGLRASIHTRKATPSDALPGISAGPEGSDTSHFSIIDSEGNIAAVTQSVNLPFGAAFVVPGTGFVLNNEMDDFSVKPGVPNAFGLIGDDANAIEPGKRPLSSMTPTILLGKDRAAAIGSPGGSRIITMVFLGLSKVLAGSSAAEAVSAPRVHHQYQPDSVSVEPGALSEAEINALTERGYTVAPAERPWGNMQVVIWNKQDGSVDAASDPRWEGVGGGESRDREMIFR